MSENVNQVELVAGKKPRDYLVTIRDMVASVVNEYEKNGYVTIGRIMWLNNTLRGLKSYFTFLSKNAPNENERKKYADLAKRVESILKEIKEKILGSSNTRVTLSEEAKQTLKNIVGELDKTINSEQHKEYILLPYISKKAHEALKRAREKLMAEKAQQASATQQALQQLQQIIAQAEVQAQEQMQAQEQKKRSRKKKQEATVSA